ncbi:hypothetical protein [Methylocella sp.]|uniref:hypothetical protein n=1 Tax=Methylocella sp. TaxID=1978226 RepID=UPI0035B01CA7
MTNKTKRPERTKRAATGEDRQTPIRQHEVRRWQHALGVRREKEPERPEWAEANDIWDAVVAKARRGLRSNAPREKFYRAACVEVVRFAEANATKGTDVLETLYAMLKHKDRRGCIGDGRRLGRHKRFRSEADFRAQAVEMVRKTNRGRFDRERAAYVAVRDCYHQPDYLGEPVALVVPLEELTARQTVEAEIAEERRAAWREAPKIAPKTAGSIMRMLETAPEDGMRPMVKIAEAMLREDHARREARRAQRAKEHAEHAAVGEKLARTLGGGFAWMKAE